MPLRLGLDLSVIPHALGGVSRYLAGLAAGLREVASGEDLEVRLTDVPATHPGLRSPALCDTVLPDPQWMRVPLARRIPYRLGAEQASRSRRLSRLLECDVYHTSGVQPSIPAKAVPVITLFDTGALEHPEWHTPQTVEYAMREASMVAGGARVLAISGWTAERASALLRLDRSSIGVAAGAADDLFTPGEPDPSILGAHGLEADRFVLHVGSYVPRKNIPFLLEAWAASGCASRGWKLVMAGAGGWRRPPVGGDGVVVIEASPDAVLLTLYRAARALVLPSVFEGLGLPALEAMACGCGVVSSSASALAATIGSAGLTIPPDDGPAWASALARLEDGSFAAGLRRAASSAPRRRWTDTAHDAAAFYRTLVR